jgi:RNA 3'-terminal phosphate cyclase (ATP)
MMPDPLLIDGAHGEGGGQILRTGVTLAAIAVRPVRFTRIRAGRRRPGMAAQHLTAVRAAAALCDAALEGDTLGSQELLFAPRRPVCAGRYSFDVAEARVGGSAGAASLVLQTVLMPLAVATGPSEVLIEGGTHLPQSPTFDYLRDVWLPALKNLGVHATVSMERWGWYPVGKGAIHAAVAGAPPGACRLVPLALGAPGDLLCIGGSAVAANLSPHIAERMADRALSLLAPLAAATNASVDVRAECVRAACPGAGMFLLAEYRNARAGFSALGARGKPAEQVAEEAVTALQAHHASGAAIDPHLADQLLLPLALASGPSRFTVAEVTRHLETNAWLIDQFGVATTSAEKAAPGNASVVVTPRFPSPLIGINA